MSSQPLRIAVAGLGRMGVVHALHAVELARETGACAVTALADPVPGRAARAAADLGCSAQVFDSVAALAAAGAADATIVVTPTENHHEHAALLVRAGQRVFLEKPLTGALASDLDFAAWLDREHPRALMLAFQRRFDPPLQYARELMQSGAIGRVFKIYSALEDSNPAPDGYKSGGILPDMSVHNVDEILWFMGDMPEAALAIGARVYSHRLTTCQEDFDDALLYMWFKNAVAQVQVSRNHVSGYRVETIIFGEQGQIHVGHFDQRPFEITVEAYGRRHAPAPVARRVFTMRDYAKPLPEFVDRFGQAYKAELAVFVDCCRSGAPFPSTHTDGVRAQRVISAGMNAIVGRQHAAAV